MRMLGALRHRGPDDCGLHVEGEISVGTQRLAIIDLAGGHQPIYSDDGNLLVVFNGEIYNFRELARELEARGVQCRTHSDTEVLLRLYELWGTHCVHHLRGMFAFAIIDRRANRVFFARDRLGVKPLYYWRGAGCFVFASEIKALLEHPAVPREPDLNAINNYLALRYVPGPESLFKGICKFPSAHWMLWDRGELRFERYWSLPAAGNANARLSDREYIDRFEELFEEAVRLRMIADVPLGAFLSGGLDSSAIVAAMARQSSVPVRTFSVGFDWGGDELDMARDTARRFGCEHHEIVCRAEDFAELPRLIWHLDEPVGDAIVMPMFLLSQLARRHVTVVLTGEGADETMGGYFMHRLLNAAHYYRRLVPRPIRRLVSAAVARLPAAALNVAFDYPAPLGERGRQRLLDYLEEVEKDDLPTEYRVSISLFGQNEQEALLTSKPQRWREAVRAEEVLPPLERILRLQYAHWLPDDILMKQDKLTMANSIEGRVPFLDHKLVEFLASVPPHLKVRWTRNKIVLRYYLHRHLPGKAARRKIPFYVPVDKYLRSGPLAEMIRICLSESSVERRGLFRWTEVKRLRQSANDGEFLYGKQLFSLLALELWFRIFIDREPGWVS